MFFSCGACLIIQVQAALTVRQFSMFINENSDFQKSGGGGVGGTNPKVYVK